MNRKFAAHGLIGGSWGQIWKLPPCIPLASILNNVAPYESDVAESVADYVDGDRLAMQGESNEILTALEAFVRWEEQYGAH